MSRIGKLPIAIPDKVKITMVTMTIVITVKGPLGELTQKVDPEIMVKVENNQILVNRPSEQKRHRAMHGLYRSLLFNMVHGVSNGYTINQELVGVGYRAEAKGQILELSLGYSHDIIMQLPAKLR